MSQPDLRMCTCGHQVLLYDKHGCLGWMVGDRPARTADYKQPSVRCSECTCGTYVDRRPESQRRQRDLLMR